MIKLLSISFLLLTFNPSFADDDNFIISKVYKYSESNGTPVFTDVEPENKKHEIKTIEAVKPTEDIFVTKLIKDRSIREGSRRRSSGRKSKKEGKQLAQCKKYKRQFEAVSEKMRVGYKASEYRKLEKKRVKYRDLLFHNCNSHDLI